ASRHLGGLGADVIKVESPAGDAIRHAPPLRADGLSHIFALCNTDKRGVVLDLKDPKQLEILHGLLSQADVLIENMRQGALAKLGVSAEVLRTRYPDLIYCSLNGFGNDSAYPGRAALDTVIQATSGLMSLTQVNGSPVKAGISASDMIAGEFGLLAVLAGLEHRDGTGRAIHFDLSMQDTSVWMTQIAWPGSSPGEPVVLREALDGFVVAIATEDDVNRVVGSQSFAESRAAFCARLSGAGIDCAPVLTTSEAMTSDHVVARQLLVQRTTADGDVWPVLQSPMRISGRPIDIRTVMPRLGNSGPISFHEVECK
ncbi:MAG: CoA transferase, partial [Alcaligenaceae bacterium]